MGDSDGEPFDLLATRLARRIAELANTADADAFAAGVRTVFSDDYVLHPRTDPDVVGVEAYIERLLGARSGLPPDWRYDFVIDDLVVGRTGSRCAITGR